MPASVALPTFVVQNRSTSPAPSLGSTGSHGVQQQMARRHRSRFAFAQAVEEAAEQEAAEARAAEAQTAEAQAAQQAQQQRAEAAAAADAAAAAAAAADAGPLSLPPGFGLPLLQQQPLAPTRASLLLHDTLTMRQQTAPQPVPAPPPQQYQQQHLQQHPLLAQQQQQTQMPPLQGSSPVDAGAFFKQVSSRHLCLARRLGYSMQL